MPRDMSQDSAVKPARLVRVYEELLAPLRGQPITLLELGVWKGDSLTMWRDGFPKATIVGVDLDPPDLDLGPRVHCERGDSTDTGLLEEVAMRHATDGFDVIVDDASHRAQPTAAALSYLFPNHLRPGGLYVIEDWATGYAGPWPDGEAPERRLEKTDLELAEASGSGLRLASHDFGMVGLVKRLVDHAATPSLKLIDRNLVGETLAIESVTFHDGAVALRKSPTAAESDSR